MRRPDPHRALLRALKSRVPTLTVLASRTQPWASATFTGAQHFLDCEPGCDLAGIEEWEFALAGHLVADIVAAGDGERVRIEALTIEIA